MEETRAQRFGRLLKALLARHDATPASIEKTTHEDGKAPISAVTVRRILKAEARTEPQFVTLSRIAEVLGESYLAAFEEERRGGIVFERKHRGNTLTLRLGGSGLSEREEREIPRRMDDLLRNLDIGRAQTAREVKRIAKTPKLKQ